MKIGVPREILAQETRVALIPANIKDFLKQNHEVLIEKGAGVSASFSDEEYRQAGATIVEDTKRLYEEADIILKVQPPHRHPELDRHEGELIKENGTYIGFMSLFGERDYLETFKQRNITSFAMEFIPRITRAQSMDALSSMATIAGYKAVLMAADILPRMFPMMMTAAGTVPPATVMVLGAGVAGLQAIATAKRLGAKVEAFDPRAAVKEQVQSLGAQFIEMIQAEDAETAGGYAKEQSEDFLRREQETIGARLPKTDVVITTAQIFGKASPILITEEMVKKMKAGSVIIDIAAEQGGNCELTEAGQSIERHNVKIVGAVNLPAALPVHASQLYAKNIANLFRHLYGGEGGRPDFQDEIVKGACITRDGQMVNAFLKERLNLEEGGE